MIIGRARNSIVYHARSGRPQVHTTPGGRRYIMVRAKGGGVKRLYENSLYEESKGSGKFKRLVLKTKFPQRKA